MRVLVCGGRNFSDRTTFLRAMDEHVIKYSKNYIDPDTGYPPPDWMPTDVVIISGGARGADEMAIDWAINNWCDFEEYEAEWSNLFHPDAVIKLHKDGEPYDANAGKRRNQQMLDQGKPDFVIAFPGGRGTADMVERATKAGIRVVQVE